MRAWWIMALAMIAGEVAADPPPIALRRPDIDLSSLVPDPMEHLRWPLGTTHPALEPRFPIARALAEDGVTWRELCRLGAQHRRVAGDKDLQQYLHAWCEVANGNIDAGFEQLAMMGTPVVPKLAPAIVTDLANLLAQRGDANHAEHVLAAAHLESVTLFDQLAATYVEIGDTSDANEINERAIERQSEASNASKCQRLTRRLLLAPEVERSRLLDGLVALTDRRRVAVDPTCQSLYDELTCWLSPASNCRGYLQARARSAQQLAADLATLDLYFRWPSRPTPFIGWLMHTTQLHREQSPGAGVMEAVALAGAFLTAPCAKLGVIGRLAVQSRTSDKLAPKYDGLLLRIATAVSDLAKVDPANRTEACNLIDRDVVVDLASLQ